MSSIDRRHMLKVMAATAAGAAASATGIEKALAESAPQATSALRSLARSSSTARPATSVRSPLAAGSGALTLMGQAFKPQDSSFAYTFAAGLGGIQSVAGAPSSVYVAPLSLPNGVVVTQVLFDLIVNDTHAAFVDFTGYNPLTGSFGPVLGVPVSGQSPSVRTVDLGIAPTTIDAANLAYALLWQPGANGPTHQLYGARVAWTMNPGMTLFPNPRRLVDGFAAPFTSGQTYGPFDATQKVYPAAGPSGIPAGAQAAFCAVQSYTSGVLTIFPDLTTNPLIANFTATVDGPLSMTYMMIPLSPAGKFKIASYITGKVVVDAWGYVV